MSKRAKLASRRLADRVLAPYFERQSAEIAELRTAISEPSVAHPGVEPGEVSRADWPQELADFNHLLHTLRTVELGRMIRPDNILLSVGCSDLSYFNWIERGLGHVGQHWGVEFYRPEPSELPANVRWFTASASHMPQVPDHSVDVIFSGQNIEHLPAGELVGFLLESRRVLRPGGHVVIDSPNRLITDPLAWRHPEHVVEFSPDEAMELMSIAGFDVTACRGFWLCEEADGRMLPLVPEPQNVAEFLRRAILASDAPNRSFCWWLEARSTQRVVDSEVLAAHVTDLVSRLWDSRVNRGAWRPGAASASDELLRRDATGLVYRAGPIPVFPGSIVATPVGRGSESLTVRLVADSGQLLSTGQGRACLTTDETVFGVWVELWLEQIASGEIAVAGVEVRPAHT